MCAGKPLSNDRRMKLLGDAELRRRLHFDTERVWTFTIYQHQVQMVHAVCVKPSTACFATGVRPLSIELGWVAQCYVHFTVTGEQMIGDEIVVPNSTMCLFRLHLIGSPLEFADRLVGSPRTWQSARSWCGRWI